MENAIDDFEDFSTKNEVCKRSKAASYKELARIC